MWGKSRRGLLLQLRASGLGGGDGLLGFHLLDLGVEHLALSRTTDLADTLGRLEARGVKVYGADADGEIDALRFAFPRPCVLVMGNEREGMKDRVRALCDGVVAIRGSGKVESLNVAAAAAVCLFEMVRQRTR